MIVFAAISSGLITTQNVQATTGGYALKPGGENNDNLNIDNGSYVISGEPGQTIDLKLMVINQEKIIDSLHMQLILLTRVIVVN